MTKLKDPIRISEVTVKVGGRDFQIKKPRIYFDEKHPQSKSKTHQSFLEETKISTIMKNYQRTGILGDPMRQARPVYGDFTGMSFTEMQQKVANIKMEFDKLSPQLKHKFKNDPQNLLEFVADPKNNEECYKLGLKDNPRIFEPYMLVDKNNQPTGVMKHPGKTAKEHKYFKDGKPCDVNGVLLPEPNPPAPPAA